MILKKEKLNTKKIPTSKLTLSEKYFKNRVNIQFDSINRKKLI